MPIPTVSDTSPLQYLHQLGQLALLEQFYGQVLVPQGVAEELEQGLKLGFDVPRLVEFDWVSSQTVTVPPELEPVELGKGEKQVLALASQLSGRALLDDLEAREVARDLGLEVTGTLGILLAAQERGALPALRPLLDELRNRGFYLGDSLYQKLLRRVGEL